MDNLHISTSFVRLINYTNKLLPGRHEYLTERYESSNSTAFPTVPIFVAYSSNHASHEFAAAGKKVSLNFLGTDRPAALFRNGLLHGVW